MKEKRILIVNTITLITVILLYYVVGTKALFLYVLSLSLYKIFMASFSNVTFKINIADNEKPSLFKMSLLTVVLISLGFLLLGILISDIISVLLDINNIMLIFIMMGISIIGKPLIKLCSEYFNNKQYKHLIEIYDILDNLLLIIIAFLLFRVFKINNNISIALLYLSKILVSFIILGWLFVKERKKIFSKSKIKDNFLLYKKEFKSIFTTSIYKSMIGIVKYSYYYISIIVLYRVLSKTYGYKIDEVLKTITFIYFYALYLFEYLIYLIKMIDSKIPRDVSITNRIYNNFKISLMISIVLGFISPLVSKVIFNDASIAIYFTMVNFLAIFILLYDITYENIKKKQIVYISLFSGLIAKIILIIPLINAFYRMGYNLIYGDIISSIVGFSISIIINYIYLKRDIHDGTKYFERLLDILYENIILSIILVGSQFIIPMDTNNYFKALGLIIVYMIISITFIKLKNKKRG